MKICFYNVTASYIHGGLETYCWEVGRALVRRGHEVSIVAGDQGEARNTEVSLLQFPFVKAERWPDFGTRFRRLMERLSFGRHSLGHLVSAGYDAVIVNKPFDFPILWRARARGLAAQTVFRSGGRDFFFGDRRFAGAVDHWASSSGYNARQVEARYGRAVTVIHNGVDTGEFRPQPGSGELRARFGMAQSDFVLVSIGRLVGWKGLHIIVDALRGLPGVRFVMAGEGAERDSLERHAREAGVAGRVHFTGRVPHQSLPALLADSDAFVQPSIGEEAFGISVVEAMACGRPVLASRQGGMLETIVPGDTGELLPAGDAAAWSEAIRRISSDAGYCRRLGAAGRQRAEQHFTWAANAQQLEALLSAPRAALSGTR